MYYLPYLYEGNKLTGWERISEEKLNYIISL
jgi:hypothetical protein